MRLGGYFGSFAFLGFPGRPARSPTPTTAASRSGWPGKAIDRFHVEQLAYFLGKLKTRPSRAGAVLDNAVVLYGAGLTNGPTAKQTGTEVQSDAHGQHNTPLLLAGGGGGAIKCGRHLNFDNGTPLANVFVNLAQAVGLPEKEQKFADSYRAADRGWDDTL